MFSKKLIIGANKTTEVLYLNGNVNSTGGYRERIPTIRDCRKGFVQVYHADDNYFDLKPKETETVGRYHTKNYKQRRSVRNSVLRELVENNFQIRKCIFITLTFDPSKGDTIAEPENEPEIPKNSFDDILDELIFPGSKPDEADDINQGESIFQDLGTCNKYFKNFIKRINYRYDGFKYVAVMSRQKTGRWHYHMICNLNYISYDELNHIWGMGSTYVRGIKTKTAFIKTENYCMKNMTVASGDLRGQKGYLASRGLNRDICLRSWRKTEENDFKQQEQRLLDAKETGLQCSKKRVTEHEYLGDNAIDEIFVESEERICTCKYYTYPLDSTSSFQMIDTAKRKDIG